MASPARPRRSRWRRVGIRILVLAAIAVLVLAASVVFGLRSRSVRGAVIARVASGVESRTGVRLTARDFHLGLTSGVIEIEGLELMAPGAGDARPFLVVPRARAVIHWRSLLGDRPVIESLSIENPSLDLRVPMPSLGEQADAGGSSALAVEILDFRLSGGAVLGQAAPDWMDTWLDGWRAAEVSLRGELRSGQAEVKEASARLFVDSHRRETIEFQTALSMRGNVQTGSLEVDSLRMEGRGLNLETRGRVELAGPAASLDLDLEADPALLFPDLTSSGNIRGSGSMELRPSPHLTLSSRLQLEVTDLPVDLVQPWFELAQLDGFFNPSGTHADLDADLDLSVALAAGAAGRRSDHLLGNAAVTWRRGGEPLLTVELHSRAPSSETDRDAGGVNIFLAGELAPAAPGQRRISGTFRAPGWLHILEGELYSAQLDLNEPDVSAATERLGLDLVALAGWRPQGEVTASLKADGRIIAPRLSLDARWTHDDEPLAVISMATVDPEGKTPLLHLRGDVALLPGAPGRREISGELLAPGWHRLAEGEIRQGRLLLEIPELAEAREDVRRRQGLLPDGLLPGAIPMELLRSRLSARVKASGPLSSPDLDVEADWSPAAGESLRVVARGQPATSYPFLAPGGEAEVTVQGLELGRINLANLVASGGEQGISGTLDGSLRGASVAGGITAILSLDGSDLSYGDLLSFPRLRVEAATDGNMLELRHLSGTLLESPPQVPVGGEFEGNGRFDLAWPPREAEAWLAMASPLEGVDRIELSIRLDEGVLKVESLEIESAGHAASIQGDLPLGALARMAGGLEALAVEPVDGPISVSVSDLDLQTLMGVLAVLGLLDTEGDLPAVRGLLNGSLTFDPADPVSATGWLAVSEIGVDLARGSPLEVNETFRIEIGEGRILLPPSELQPTGGLIQGSVPLKISGIVDLNPAWKPGDDLDALVENISLDLDGTVDAVLLNPFLAGGTASGAMKVEATVRGAGDNLTADIRILGPRASVLYVRPYPTKLENLEVDLSIQDGEVTLERARARLNGGTAEMTGTFTPGDGLRAKLVFDGARYRLDFGIATRLSGDLDLEWPLEGRRRIGGRVVVERAVLRRDIVLNRHLLDVLFDVRPEAGANQVLDTIDLDISVLTDEGVLIKNNVADVQADWGRLEITGTAADPRLDGRVDVRPGGIVTAFGQALRIDEASLEWAGEPAGQPRWVWETTSSQEDPSILKAWRNELFSPADLGPGRGGGLDFWQQSQTTTGGGWEMAAQGVMTQATSAQRTQLSFEPLPLFGETDTQARFTLSQDLSRQLTFIASTNPRETEAQTYILDIHRLPVFQSFRAQVFTNDQKKAGLTIQQTLKLGPRTTSEIQDPFLRTTTIEAPDDVKKRRLRRAIDFRKSDPFTEGAALDVEVDVIDALRRQGYPSGEVAVDLEPAGDNRVDLLVTVDPGAPVRFVFEGNSLSSRTRRAIISTYRPAELGEEASLAEVQKETVQFLHALGYLRPQVDVELIPADPSVPGGSSLVRVTIQAGKQAELSELAVEGLPDEDSRVIAELFGSTALRVNLAMESPASDVLLLRALEERGYPEARLTLRELSEDGKTLVIRIEPGTQRRLVSVEITGLGDEDLARLTDALSIREGDPVHSDEIASAAREMERDLRGHGHADARVRALLKPVAEDRPHDVALHFEAEPGPSYRLEAVHFEGLRQSRPKWVKKVAGLDPGQTFRSKDVAEARARLYRTGVFRRIRSSTERGEEDAGSKEASPGIHPAEPVSPTLEPGGGEKIVTFEMEEARRWQLAYGGRWEEERGVGVVVDLLNRHSLGIGHLTGVRGILGSKDRSLRLYHVIPRVVGERSSLELFAERRQEELSATAELRVTEAWAQLTFPLTRRTTNRPYIRFQWPDIEQTVSDPNNPLDDRAVSPLLGYQVAFDGLSRRVGEQRRQGVFAGIDLLGSHESLGSDVTLVGVVSQFKYFWPLGKPASGRFTWAQFWRAGLVEAKDQDVPFADRFRAGGEFSVRGYPTNSLGPLADDGTPLGGEVMFIVNQELHADLLRTQSAGSVSALAFFDAGNVWPDREAVEADLFKSTGIGFRYNSPVGPLRLDFAVPLDRRPTDPDYKIYVGFGSVF